MITSEISTARKGLMGVSAAVTAAGAYMGVGIVGGEFETRATEFDVTEQNEAAINACSFEDRGPGFRLVCVLGIEELNLDLADVAFDGPVGIRTNKEFPDNIAVEVTPESLDRGVDAALARSVDSGQISADAVQAAADRCVTLETNALLALCAEGAGAHILDTVTDVSVEDGSSSDSQDVVFATTKPRALSAVSTLTAGAPNQQGGRANNVAGLVRSAQAAAALLAGAGGCYVSRPKHRG